MAELLSDELGQITIDKDYAATLGGILDRYSDEEVVGVLVKLTFGETIDAKQSFVDHIHIARLGLREYPSKRLRSFYEALTEAERLGEIFGRWTSTNDYDAQNLAFDQWSIFENYLDYDTIVQHIGANKRVHPYSTVLLLEQLRTKFDEDIFWGSDLSVEIERPDYETILTYYYIHLAGIDLEQKLEMLKALQKRNTVAALAPFLEKKADQFRAYQDRLQEAVNQSITEMKKVAGMDDNELDLIMDEYACLGRACANSYDEILERVKDLRPKA